MNTQFDLIVIGAGPGGYESALEAGKLGLRTAIVEKDAVGGTCLNRGCIPTKTLMHSSDLVCQIRGASRFGVGAGEPSIDMEAVQQHKDDTVETLQKGILSLFKTRKVSLYRGLGTILPAAGGDAAIAAEAPDKNSSGMADDAQAAACSAPDLETAASDAVTAACSAPDVETAASNAQAAACSAPDLETAASCDAACGRNPGTSLPLRRVKVTAEDGEETILEAPYILLATGSVPSHPPIPGSDLPGCMTSDELLSYRGEPFQSLMIIGGGVIGMEFAGIYQNFGSRITILEALPSLIANMDKELGQSLKLSLKKKGADIHTGARVMKLEQGGDGLVCTYLEKDREQTCTAEAVLIAVGRRSYTEGVFPEGAAPDMERGRVLVGADYETSISGIYAIGDVNGQIQLAHAAAAQGKHAVHVIAQQLGKEPAGTPLPAGAQLVPSCVYTDPEIASVGMTLDQAKEAGLPAKSHKIVSSANGKSVLSLQERGFVKVVYLEDTHVIIGAQMLCARATDMISEFAVAIRREMTLEQMADVLRPHPTFSEMITDAATL